MMNRNTVNIFSKVALGLGVLSIFGSLFAWFSSRTDPAQRHGELSEGQRLGNFIGLWPPTLFIISNLLDRWSKDM